MAADAETPQTFAAKATIVIPAPKGGVTVTKYERIQAAAQKIIESLLPAAEKRAMRQLGLNPNEGLSIKVTPVPESLLFELNAIGPSSREAANFANNVAGQLEQALPKADPVAIKQLEVELGAPPVLLLWEAAQSSSVTAVRH